MTKKFKKLRIVTALVLVFLMIALIPFQAGAAAATATGAEKRITVHFYNALHWNTPHLYYFDGVNHEYGWPGVVMQNDGNGWYSYTVTGLDAIDIVFNDGGSQQLPVSSYDSYHVTADTWYANGTYYNEAPGNIEEPDPIVVHFYNKDKWSEVYMHYYSPDNKMVGDKWPGAVMEPEGNGWYRYTIYGYGEAKVIFNNSLGQQLPQAPSDGSTADGYLTSGEKWFADGKWHEQNPKQITVHYYNDANWKTPTIYYYSDGVTSPSWPGTKMTSEGNGWYQYTILDCDQAKVVFSDNGASQIPAKNQEGYLVNSEKWFARGTWYTAKPQSFKVHYFNENRWACPYIYYYNGSNNGGAWPGNKMQAENYGWYSYDIIGYDQANVIFSNNGASQNPAQGQESFLVNKEKWYLNGTWHEKEPEHITVHFYNYDNWSKVNMYYYDGDKTGSDWTGLPMKSEGDGWYTYKIYDYDQARVLFNNGGSTQIPGRLEEGFLVSNERWYRNGTWTTDRPKDITVHFYKPSSWSAPNLYYYLNDNDNGGAWPGAKMITETEFYGKYSTENWYTYKITRYSDAKVVFNDGAHQNPRQFQEGYNVSGEMWYKDGVWCDSKMDTDGDELPNYLEMIIGSDFKNPDSDNDGLIDGYEINILNTNPIKKDTDGNDINDGDEDFDYDGLTNGEEVVLKTDPTLLDTDFDDLTDFEEVNTHKTNPTKTDTDDDDANDGWEIQNSFDPLTYNATFEVTVKAEGSESEFTPSVTLDSISGEQIASITIDKVAENELINDAIPGYIDSAYDFSIDGEFDSANLTFEFDNNLLEDPEFQPAIYYFDEENQTLEELENQTVVGNTVNADTAHFSKYILLNKTAYDKVWNADIKLPSDSKKYIDVVFVLDISMSMLSNDPQNVRKTVTTDFVQKLRDNDRASVVTFRKNAETVCGLTSNKQNVFSAVNSIVDDNGTNSLSGTNGSAGIYTAINILSDGAVDREKIIIFLTDGEDNSFSYNYNDLISSAHSKGITAYTIGLGGGINENQLKSIASGTNGKYYKATVADELFNNFGYIFDENIDFVTDSNNDGISDYFTKLMCEGKLLSGTGIALFKGKSYSAVQANADFDGDGLKNGQEATVIVSGKKVYMKVYSSPLLPDTDYDGLLDGDIKETNPLIWNVGDRDLAIFSSLAYENGAGYINDMYKAEDIHGSKKEIGESYYFHRYASIKNIDEGISKKWMIVDFQELWSDLGTHFSATTFKNGKNIIIAYRGTDEGLGEWGNNIIGVGLMNYHSETQQAKWYASYIADSYKNYNIYITGHSLGGYLAQFGAAEILQNKPNVNLRKVVYFNGIGMKYNKLLPGNEKVMQLLKNYSNNGGNSKLISYQINGDVVSALGTHSGKQIGFFAAPSSVMHHAGQYGNGPIAELLSWGSAGLLTALSNENILYYYDYYHSNSIVEYFWVTHETDSFLWHLQQGTRRSPI